jgi:hypothetical protein
MYEHTYFVEIDHMSRLAHRPVTPSDEGLTRQMS